MWPCRHHLSGESGFKVVVSNTALGRSCAGGERKREERAERGKEVVDALNARGKGGATRNSTSELEVGEAPCRRVLHVGGRGERCG